MTNKRLFLFCFVFMIAAPASQAAKKDPCNGPLTATRVGEWLRDGDLLTYGGKVIQVSSDVQPGPRTVPRAKIGGKRIGIATSEGDLVGSEILGNELMLGFCRDTDRGKFLVVTATGLSSRGFSRASVAIEENVESVEFFRGVAGRPFAVSKQEGGGAIVYRILPAGALEPVHSRYKISKFLGVAPSSRYQEAFGLTDKGEVIGFSGSEDGAHLYGSVSESPSAQFATRDGILGWGLSGRRGHQGLLFWSFDALRSGDQHGQGVAIPPSGFLARKVQEVYPMLHSSVAVIDADMSSPGGPYVVGRLVQGTFSSPQEFAYLPVVAASDRRIAIVEDTKKGGASEPDLKVWVLDDRDDAEFRLVGSIPANLGPVHRAALTDDGSSLFVATPDGVRRIELPR